MDKQHPAALPFDIDHGTRELPPKQINARHIGTAYVWNSTTQELIPILPEDHPQYRENRDRLLEAFKRWNRCTSR